MGIYDYVLGMQVKATPNPSMCSYGMGDEVPLADGAYLCFEGVFIIKHGKVVVGSSTVFNKWGGQVDIYELLNPYNPVRIIPNVEHIDEDLKKGIREFDEELKKK